MTDIELIRDLVKRSKSSELKPGEDHTLLRMIKRQPLMRAYAKSKGVEATVCPVCNLHSLMCEHCLNGRILTVTGEEL